MKNRLILCGVASILLFEVASGTVKLSQYIDLKKQEQAEIAFQQRAYESVNKFYKQCIFTYQYGFLRPQTLCTCLTNKTTEVLKRDFVYFADAWKEGTGITQIIDKAPENKREELRKAILFCDHMQAMTRGW